MAICSRDNISSLLGPHGAAFDAFFESALNKPVHINAGGMNVVHVEFAGLDNFLHFHHGDFAGGGGERIKVARGMAINDVAVTVRLPAFDDGEVADNGLFKNVR